MRVLTTFPGRAGDIAWALPTVRAISEHFDTPVDLLIAGEFASLVPLLAQQPYLGRVFADPDWALVPPAEWDRATPIEGYDRVYKLGYRGWPSQPLPFEVWNIATLEYGLPLPELDLTRPWIAAAPFKDAVGHPYTVVGGWSDCWFELKYGICQLLVEHVEKPFPIVCPIGSRWSTEPPMLGSGLSIYETDWTAAARFIQSARVFLGDCSALHVLAVALGKPCVIMEPMEARWNSIFYPLGTHDRVRLVRGNDGLATFDARHCADTLAEALRET